MRIVHLSGAYVPSRRASSVAVMKMCEALAKRGHTVTAITKAGEVGEAGNPFEIYGVERCFELQMLRRPKIRFGSGVLLAEQMAELVKRRGTVDLLYARDVVAAAVCARIGIPVLYEAHEPPSTNIGKVGFLVLAQSPQLRRLCAVTGALARELTPYARGRSIVVAPSAADPLPEAPPEPIRRGDRPIAGYVGSLYEGKGVELVVEVARLMPEVDFVVIGGRPEEISSWQSRGVPENVRFLGFVNHGALAGYYRSLDVALLPNRKDFVGTPGGKIDISRWTSPLKMLEYMASGAPIVASDLAILQEVLEHERNALIAPVASPDAWVRSIRRLLEDKALAIRLSTEAKRDLLESHTYAARARLVMNGLE
ncbi:MAG: glycosyltransferase family 4 protein [Deltaproteobacteria bacterium]|nr:glycosyltransferase family 4 protein [Deltaproteobacteria bacterium]